MSQTRLIPLFPLGSVLVPGLVLPLHIFEPRYRRLLDDISVLPEDDRGFGVVAIRDGREVGADGVNALFEVGTFASLREVDTLEDGRSDIVTVGTERFRIVSFNDELPYLRAEVEMLDEDPGEAADALGDAVVDAFTAYRSIFTETDDEDLPDDPRVLSYLVAAAVVADLPMRQEFLSASDDTRRLRDELAFLRREVALIEAIPSLPAVDLTREQVSPN
ncbi:MAG: LON peptidase substrate-binding domain-containing protein [Candidatus Nanopelagicales bacterium]|jgi:Lon protease-like protein